MYESGINILVCLVGFLNFLWEFTIRRIMFEFRKILVYGSQQSTVSRYLISWFYPLGIVESPHIKLLIRSDFKNSSINFCWSQSQPHQQSPLRPARSFLFTVSPLSRAFPPIRLPVNRISPRGTKFCVFPYGNPGEEFFGFKTPRPLFFDPVNV